MIATIIGGTGLTGSFLVRKLLADSAITKVISISRRPLEASNTKLTEVLVRDLAELPSIESTIRGELYFCCLGTTIKAAGSKENFEKVDHDAVVAFAKIAKAHRARSVTFITAMGANANSMFFYNQVKGRTENDVKALGLRSLIIFRPALLVRPRSKFRSLAESIANRALVPLSRVLPAGIGKRFITPAEILAERMLADGKLAPAGVHVIDAKDV
ncbi:MAG: NAD(P)H-binding protein [Candidatus Acidiferrales bacterium]